MSLLIGMINNQGVVLGADTAIMTRKKEGNKVTGSKHKLFKVFKNQSIVIGFCGNPMLRDVMYENIIGEYAQINQNKIFDTVSQFGEHFLAYIEHRAGCFTFDGNNEVYEKILEEENISKDDISSTIMFAGYGSRDEEGVILAYKVTYDTRKGIEKKECENSTKRLESEKKGIYYTFGCNEIVEAYIKGIDPRVSKKIYEFIEKDNSNTKEIRDNIHKICNEMQSGFLETIQKCELEELQKKLIYLMDITVEYLQFMGEQPSVNKPIDTMIISKEEFIEDVSDLGDSELKDIPTLDEIM